MSKTFKPMGLIRKLDDLGRLVFPKEVRERLELNQSDKLEFFVVEGGGIYIRKFQPERPSAEFKASIPGVTE